jgi:hypothetical protein
MHKQCDECLKVTFISWREKCQILRNIELENQKRLAIEYRVSCTTVCLTLSSFQQGGEVEEPASQAVPVSAGRRRVPVRGASYIWDGVPVPALADTGVRCGTLGSLQIIDVKRWTRFVPDFCCDMHVHPMSRFKVKMRGPTNNSHWFMENLLLVGGLPGLEVSFTLFLKQSKSHCRLRLVREQLNWKTLSVNLQP